MYANLHVTQHSPEGDVVFEAEAWMVFNALNGDLVVHLDANDGGRDPIPAGESVVNHEDGPITVEASF